MRERQRQRYQKKAELKASVQVLVYIHFERPAVSLESTR